MIQVSDRILQMGESETLAMARMSRELRAQGKDVINLSLGEPDFDTPEFIREAAKTAIDQNFSHYTPVGGYDDLLEAIVYKLKRDNGLIFQKSQIVVSTGAKQSIANVVMSVINPGDEVIVPAPYWVSYREIIKLAAGKAVVVPAGIEKDFKALASDIAPFITEKTKMFLFSSPNNPTGAVYTKEELEELGALFAQYPDITIVSDEIYELIRFEKEHHSIASVAAVRDQVVIVNGLSKGFAMTGWRLGYIAAPEAIAKACVKFQGQITSATCSITQRAAITALKADPATMDYMKEAFKSRRDQTFEQLSKIPGIKVNMPPAAFYFFLGVEAFLGKSFEGEKIENADALCMYLLNEGLVALVPGTAFGAEGYIRFSYSTTQDQIDIAISRISEALSKLN